jgi:hypothetical protein
MLQAMAATFPNWLARVARFGKLLAVVVALAGQVSAGAVSAPAASQDAALHAAMILCSAANHPGKDGRPPVHHHVPDPAIAAQALHLVQQAAILDAGNFLAPPPLGAAVWSGLPAARAPPPRYTAANYPTGPPKHLI